MKQLRTVVLGSIWGRGRSKRAPELALIICSDPIRADPEMAIASEAILSFIRYLHRKPQEVTRLWCIAQTYSDQGGRRGLRSNFPIRRLLDAVKVVGATISPYGTISHPATPNLVIHRLNVKEFVPFLREMARHRLVSNLATRSSKISRGRPCRSDFASLTPLVDWPATLAGLIPRKDEIVESPQETATDQGSSFETRSKALSVILSGAQRTMERLHRHKEPTHPGLAPPSSPLCPWCDAQVEETHHHLFWECEAFEALRTPRVLKIRSIQGPFQDLPIAR